MPDKKSVAKAESQTKSGTRINVRLDLQFQVAVDVADKYTTEELKKMIAQRGWHPVSKFRSVEKLVMLLRQKDVTVVNYDRIQIDGLAKLLTDSNGWITSTQPIELPLNNTSTDETKQAKFTGKPIK